MSRVDARCAESFARQGLMQTLRAALTEAEDGRAVIEAPISEADSQQHGFAHAGLTFALGDSAAGYAALTLMEAGQEVLTAEMKVNLLAPAKGSTLRAEGRVEKPGRRLMVVTAEVFDETGARVALMQGTMVPVGGSAG